MICFLSLFCIFALFYFMTSYFNLDPEEDGGLGTIFEVPIPVEVSQEENGTSSSWNTIKSWFRNSFRSAVPSSGTNLLGCSCSEIQMLLDIMGAPLLPVPLPCNNIKDYPTERSVAKYIVQQYIAAVGGDRALDGIDSMVAVGKVKMIKSDLCSGDGYTKEGRGEVGSFVLWHKRPDLWSLQLILSYCKVNAGSDGNVAWRQTPWQHSLPSQHLPRPLRRSLQGLDPRSTANLFWNSTCVSEKSVSGEDCFVLQLETEASILKTMSGNNVETIMHTLSGYFSQKTGLLVKFEDTYLLRIRTSRGDNIFQNMTMKSLIQDYRVIDGISIAHGGTTFVSIFSFGDCDASYSLTRMEEVWEIADVDFNINGLGMECFLPPSDLKKEKRWINPAANSTYVPFTTTPSLVKISRSKVAAIDDKEPDSRDDNVYMSLPPNSAHLVLRRNLFTVT